MICGGPKSGKTSAAKEVAERLGHISYVNQATAVQFAFSITNSIPNDSKPSSFCCPTNVDLSSLLALRGEILIALDAKANEGKKPSKGDSKGKKVSSSSASADDSISLESLYGEGDLTDSFCNNGISLELLQKCVAAQLLTEPNCQRKGFILDIWGSELSQEGLISLNSMFGCLNKHAEDSKTELNNILDLVVELQVVFYLPYLFFS
jgi:hypothetical protein